MERKINLPDYKYQYNIRRDELGVNWLLENKCFSKFLLVLVLGNILLETGSGSQSVAILSHPHPRAHLAMSGDIFLFVTTWRGQFAAGIEWVEVKGATKHFTMYRTRKNYLVKKCQ